MKKDWYKSKAVWGGVLVAVGGALGALGLPELGSAIGSIGIGMGFVGVRFAQK